LETATAGTPELALAAKEAEAAFREALANDLNAPEAVGATFTFIQRANAELDRRGKDQEALAAAIRVFGLMDGVLDIQPRAQRFMIGVDLVTPLPSTDTGLMSEEVEAISWAAAHLQARLLARRERDFAKSDALRAEVEERGFAVKDTPQGTLLERYR
jgi:cysteinyl-tRNA synthetase